MMTYSDRDSFWEVYNKAFRYDNSISNKDYTNYFTPDVTKPITIKKVIFNDPCTIILWSDKTKTIVKCGEDEKYDPEKGMAMAISKKSFGNKGNYYENFKKWLPEEEEETSFEDYLNDVCTRSLQSIMQDYYMNMEE